MSRLSYLRAAFAFALFVCLVMILTPAFAQVVGAAPGSIDLGAAWNAWVAGLLIIVNAIVGVAVGVVVWWLRAKWNIDIDAGHREALQTAVQNAAGLALNRLGNQIQGKTIAVGNPALAGLANYVVQSAPGALAHFGLDKAGVDAIEQKIIAKIPQVANTASSAPPGGPASSVS